jgi:predicted AAA+ superfamily ATPase
MYIQVAYLLESDKTKQREFSSLLQIRDSWPKYVLTLDEIASGNIDGVQWMRIDDFLLSLPPIYSPETTLS